MRVAQVKGRMERMEGEEREGVVGRRRERIRRRVVENCILLRRDLG